MSPACRPRHAPLSRTKLNTSWAFPTLLRRIAPAAGGHANCVMMKIWATMSTTLPSQNRAHARLGETLARIEVIGVGLCADLGAALAHYQDGPSVHYVSNIDPSHLHDVLAGLDPASTLIIVTSKTFTTVETMQNAALARDWLIAGGADYAPRIVAVTAAPETAINWGGLTELLFDFDEAVGGRYSLWSAVGLPAMNAS